LTSSFAGIAKAAQILLQGGIVAFPTETFYGLAADAIHLRALKKIFQAKGREEGKPLLLLIGDRAWVPGLAQRIPPLAEKLMARFWPGPLTLVLEAAPHLPEILTAGTGKVGLRLSSHPVAGALTRAMGRAITGTSANLSGEAGLCLAEDVCRSLGGRIDAVVDGGRTGGGLGSTVLDVSGERPRILRAGAVSSEELAAFLS
jgi:L-threonylcarbamoyladenylate synthase